MTPKYLSVVDNCPLTLGQNKPQCDSVPRGVHPILRRLGATIRSLRVQRKLSQEALADRADIDRSYMSGIERGLRNISVLHAVRIARALEVSLPELLHLEAQDAELMTGSPSWLTALVENHPGLTEVPISVSGVAGREEVGEWEVGRYLSLG